jgi:hypothetical protein
MFKIVREKIIKNASNKEQGIENHLKYDLHKLCNLVPLFVKGMYSCITANPSVGKTTLLNYILFTTIRNAIKSDKKLKIIWFALEDGEEKIICALASWLLYETYGDKIGYLELNSFGDKALSKDILNKLEEIEPLIDQYLSYLQIDDDTSNPTGMYNIVKQHAVECGHIRKVKKKFGNEERDVFESVDNDDTVIVVTDHVSLLSNERDCLTLRDSMLKWSHYCKQYITVKFNYCVLNVHQQQAAAENVEHFKNGRIIPTQDKLADAPVMGRDYRMIIGLFYPHKYDIKQELGYDIITLKESYRSIYIIKNTFGESNKAVGTWFDGSCSLIRELPKSSEYDKMKHIYAKKK